MAIDVILGLGLFGSERGVGFSRLVDKTGQAFAVHLDVNFVPADEVALETQEIGAVIPGRLKVRLDTGLMRA
ncbi:MAG TPA: hypothetical protein VNY06_05565 [Methylocella sp.]|nr:hypothetical protein [Methylocella sp.]